MKRLHFITVIIILIFLLSSCRRSTASFPSSDSKIAETKQLNFSVQYLRTNGENSYLNIPRTELITSKQQLDSYIMASETEKYDDAYFENNLLIMAVIEETSGSNRHEVKKAELTNGVLSIYIDRIVPEMGTCDMAMWHTLIELKKDIGITSEENIKLYIDNKIQSQYIEYSYLYSNICVERFDGWEYEIIPYNENNSYYYAIKFHPAAEENGNITVAFFGDKIRGLCGTGMVLENEDKGDYTISHAKENKADGTTVWVQSTYIDTAGNYIIFNDGATEWLDSHKDDVTDVISTVQVAKNITTQKHAESVAKLHLENDTDEVKSKYDFENGIWSVTIGEKVAQIRANGSLIE